MTETIGIIMNGVTGRMGTNQHLVRSILAIREQGGVRLADGRIVMPDPILAGRSAGKLKALAEKTGVKKWTTDVEGALKDPAARVYFDAQTTDRRFEWVSRAIEAGKDVYCEKPTATSTADAMALYRKARAAGVKHGVVQDKLWLPGLRKLRRLIEGGVLGRILSVRGEFGYWVFEGDRTPAQRPSWNYRSEEGGGIIFDMFAHWRYVLDGLFGPVRSVCCLGARHIPKRWDEAGEPYEATADDAAYSLLQLEGGIVAQFNSSWCVRVRRDDLLTLQVDGTEGTAVAGLRKCRLQTYGKTPRPVWNPDVDSPIDYFADWEEAPVGPGDQENAFKAQWELFLRHLAADEPFPWTLLAGARGVQLAQAAMESWQRRAWVDLAPLDT